MQNNQLFVNKYKNEGIRAFCNILNKVSSNEFDQLPMHIYIYAHLLMISF